MKYVQLILITTSFALIYSSCSEDQRIESTQTELITENEPGSAGNELLQPFLEQYRQENAFKDSIAKKYDLFENWKKFKYTTHGLDSVPGRNVLIDSLVFSNSYNEKGNDIVVLNKPGESFYFHIDSDRNSSRILQSEDIQGKMIIIKVDQFRKVNYNDYIVRGELIEIIDENEYAQGE